VVSPRVWSLLLATVQHTLVSRCERSFLVGSTDRHLKAPAACPQILKCAPHTRAGPTASVRAHFELVVTANVSYRPPHERCLCLRGVRVGKGGGAPVLSRDEDSSMSELSRGVAMEVTHPSCLSKETGPGWSAQHRG